MYYILTAIGALATSAVVAQDMPSIIHGKNVTAECLRSYTAAFAPEMNRTAQFAILAQAVTAPPELKERTDRAAAALQSYQDALRRIDEKLANPVSPEDKIALSKAQEGTKDIRPTLAEVAGQQDPKVKEAFQSFLEARQVEVEAAKVVKRVCPADVDDL